MNQYHTYSGKLETYLKNLMNNVKKKTNPTNIPAITAYVKVQYLVLYKKAINFVIVFPLSIA